MKKFLVLISIIFVFSLTACLNPSLPHGIWQNEDQNMTLFIDSELIISGDGEWGGTFPGVYIQDSEAVDIIIQIEWKGSNISLGIVGERPFFNGSYSVINDRLYIDEHTRRDSYGRAIPGAARSIVFQLVEVRE